MAVGGTFSRLSEADGLQPGSGSYANVTWKSRDGAPGMVFVPQRVENENYI